MKTLIPAVIVLITIGFTSCTTILRSTTHKVNVFSNAAQASVTINDSVYKLPAKIQVSRSKLPLAISYQSANKQFDTLVTPYLGPLFYLGNLASIPVFGVGYAIDLTNQKRFQYSKHIFFNDKEGLEIHEYKADRYIAKRNITDPKKQVAVREHIKRHFDNVAQKRKEKEALEFKRFHPTEGTFKFNIQPPTLFLIGLSKVNQKVDRFTNTVGGVGFGIGFDYYYKNNRFFGFETSFKGNEFDPFWWTYNDRRTYKIDLSLRNGHRYKRFEYGYGPSFTYTSYRYNLPGKYLYEDEISTKHYSYRTLGFSTLFNYQLTSVMYVGLRYNPSVYSFRKTGNGFDYEHVIGIDYRIKF